jgi:hypothetical protein
VENLLAFSILQMKISFTLEYKVILYTKCIAPRKVIENTISHLHDKLYTDSAAQEKSRQR